MTISCLLSHHHLRFPDARRFFLRIILPTFSLSRNQIHTRFCFHCPKIFRSSLGLLRFKYRYSCKDHAMAFQLPIANESRAFNTWDEPEHMNVLHSVLCLQGYYVKITKMLRCDSDKYRWPASQVYNALGRAREQGAKPRPLLSNAQELTNLKRYSQKRTTWISKLRPPFHNQPQGCASHRSGLHCAPPHRPTQPITPNLPTPLFARSYKSTRRSSDSQLTCDETMSLRICSPSRRVVIGTFASLRAMFGDLCDRRGGTVSSEE
jgi:hypothetical protein